MHRFASFLPPNDFARETFGKGADVLRREEVEVRRLDAVFDQITHDLSNPIVFLKMDTQGYDLEVLQGAAGCLDRICALQSELSVSALYEGMPDYQEALTRYRRRGFEITGFYPIFRNEHSLMIAEFDCVMVRARISEGRPTRIELQ